MKPLTLLLCLGLLLSAGCATKAPSTPAQPVTPYASTAAPPPKKPLTFYLFSWMGLFRKLIPRKAEPPQAEAPRFIGVVKMVNTQDRFVLIDAVTYQTANPGDLLLCLMNQKETANLRMSTLKNPPFLIADIASGTPSPGDRVYKP